MTAALVSVVVPSFNRAYCLAGAIDSVLSQTYGDLEIVLVDDGSTDDTRALVQRRWGDEPRVRYFYQSNLGVSAARNLGLRHARGSYLALLDSDDVWMPWKLEAQLACLAAFPDAGMIWTDMTAVDPAGHVLSSMYLRVMYDAYRWFPSEELFTISTSLTAILPAAPERLRQAVVRYGDIFSPMLMGNLVHTSTVLIRRDRYEHVKNFDESMATGEDYDFHLRTCRAGPVAFLEAASVRYQCGRADQLGRGELGAQIAQNFIRTVECAIERDRERITLPRWMIARSRSHGHRWLGEALFSAGDFTKARPHLALSLSLYPWQIRTAMLLAASLLPRGVTSALRKNIQRVKAAL